MVAITDLAAGPARFYLLYRAWEFRHADTGAKARRRDRAAAGARNFTQSIYQRETLIAGDVFFDEVGMLQAGEFDSEAVFDMTDNAACSFADGDRSANRGSQFRSNCDRRA